MVEQYDKDRSSKDTNSYGKIYLVNPPDEELQPNKVLLEAKDTLNGNEKTLLPSCKGSEHSCCAYSLGQFCLLAGTYKVC